jgi:hypothetical protein
MPDTHPISLPQADAELLYIFVTRELESSRGSGTTPLQANTTTR